MNSGHETPSHLDGIGGSKKTRKGTDSNSKAFPQQLRTAFGITALGLIAACGNTTSVENRSSRTGEALNEGAADAGQAEVEQAQVGESSPDFGIEQTGEKAVESEEAKEAKEAEEAEETADAGAEEADAGAAVLADADAGTNADEFLPFYFQVRGTPNTVDGQSTFELGICISTFKGNIAFTAENLPEGITVSFDPKVATPQDIDVSVEVSGLPEDGIYPITITGTGEDTGEDEDTNIRYTATVELGQR